MMQSAQQAHSVVIVAYVFLKWYIKSAGYKYEGELSMF